MKTMTIREIAELCEVDETTVCRWIEKASCKMPELSCKMQEARDTKKAASYGLPETLAIIRSGGKNTLAALLEQNAAEKKASGLPTAAFLREMRALYGASEAARRLDYLIGYKRIFPVPQITEEKAPPAVAEKAFGQLHLIAEGAKP